jgi:hypothetical protein
VLGQGGVAKGVLPSHSLYYDFTIIAYPFTVILRDHVDCLGPLSAILENELLTRWMETMFVSPRRSVLVPAGCHLTKQASLTYAESSLSLKGAQNVPLTITGACLLSEGPKVGHQRQRQNRHIRGWRPHSADWVGTMATDYDQKDVVESEHS